MISLFSNDESPDSAQTIPVPAPKLVAPQMSAPPAYSTAQHPAVSKTVVAPVAPAPEKHGIFSWLSIGKAKKRLQMLETVSLGEKRFVALVQVDGRQFLIGGAPSNVGMIAELAPEETFQQVLRDATQDGNELPAPQALMTGPVQAAPVQQVMPIAPTAAAPMSQPAPIALEVEAVAAKEEEVLQYPQPLAFGSAPAQTHSPIEAAKPSPASTQAPSAPVKTPIPFPVSTQPVAPSPVVAAAAPPSPEPKPVVAEQIAPLAQVVSQPPVAPVAPAVTHHISVAPFALAEAVVPAGATVSPAPAPVKPSLPPHVAARLAELGAATPQAALEPHAALPHDDLSLEEPISFSPSLLAAMQQRARAALLKELDAVATMQPAPVQQSVPEATEPIAQKLPSASAPAPSFTFQFSPTLSSTTQAARIPGMKLQGAA